MDDSRAIFAGVDLLAAVLMMRKDWSLALQPQQPSDWGRHVAPSAAPSESSPPPSPAAAIYYRPPPGYQNGTDYCNRVLAKGDNATIIAEFDRRYAEAAQTAAQWKTPFQAVGNKPVCTPGCQVR